MSFLGTISHCILSYPLLFVLGPCAQYVHPVCLMEFGEQAAFGATAGLEIYFELQRKPFYYSANFVLPSSVFMVLSYVSFWISPGAAPARIAIGIIPVLIMVSQMSSVYSTLPPISYATWLSK